MSGVASPTVKPVVRPVASSVVVVDGTGGGGPGIGVDNLLLETADNLLLETGDALILE